MFNTIKYINVLNHDDFHRPTLARELVTLLSMITMFVVGVLSMASVVPTDVGSYLLIATGTVVLANFCYMAFNAWKQTNNPQKGYQWKLNWKDIVPYVAMAFFYFFPSVVGGGLTMAGINTSGIILGGCCVVPFAVGLAVAGYREYQMHKKVEENEKRSKELQKSVPNVT